MHGVLSTYAVGLRTGHCRPHRSTQHPWTSNRWADAGPPDGRTLVAGTPFALAVSTHFGTIDRITNRNCDGHA